MPTPLQLGSLFFHIFGLELYGWWLIYYWRWNYDDPEYKLPSTSRNALVYFFYDLYLGAFDPKKGGFHYIWSHKFKPKELKETVIPLTWWAGGWLARWEDGSASRWPGGMG